MLLVELPLPLQLQPLLLNQLKMQQVFGILPAAKVAQVVPVLRAIVLNVAIHLPTTQLITRNKQLNTAYWL